MAFYKWEFPFYIAIMSTTVTLDKAGRVVIPKTLRDDLQLAPGDILALESDGDSVVLRPVVRLLRYVRSMAFGCSAAGRSSPVLKRTGRSRAYGESGTAQCAVLRSESLPGHLRAGCHLLRGPRASRIEFRSLSKAGTLYGLHGGALLGGILLGSDREAGQGASKSR